MEIDTGSRSEKQERYRAQGLDLQGIESESEILSRAERVELSLRSLYRGWGYLPYRMSRFEPYDLYAQNRSFIVGNSILTFTDTDGRLMALKPDVTMSIVKNYRGGQQKVYYSENVYRESGASHELTELMQAGLECIGEIDLYSQYEVLILACESLKLISDDYILDVAHAGVVEALLRRTPVGEGEKAALLGYVQSKNEHNISELCAAQGVPEEIAEVWRSLAGLYGPLSGTLPRLRELCAGDGEMSAACAELETLPGAFSSGERLMLDFSIITDLSYYNGLVFKGSVQGVPATVLSGGRYDKLVGKLGKKAGAIGFAVYLDALEYLPAAERARDADALLLYAPGTPPEAVAERMRALRAEGLTVRARPEGGVRGSYGRIIRLEGGQDNA